MHKVVAECQDLEALHIIASFALANTIFAAYELGLWEELSGSNVILDVDKFIQDRALDSQVTWGIVNHLVRRSVLRHRELGRVSLGSLGEEIITRNQLPYIVYYVGGYGKVVNSAAALAQRKSLYGKDISRNSHYVALGTHLMSLTKHHGSYSAVLTRAGLFRPKLIVDLGCGDGALLCSLMHRTDAETGIGVDISSDVCTLASATVASAGLADRITILNCDLALTTQYRPDLIGRCDLVICMMVLHEFIRLGNDKMIATLRTLVDLVSTESGRVLILDKHTDVLENGAGPLYFTEYKLAHDLTQQDLCTEAEWRRLFRLAGLDIIYKEILPMHTGSILFECRNMRQ